MLPDSIDSSSPFLPSLLLFPDQSLCRQTKVRSRNLHSAQNSKWELARATERYRYRQVQVRSCSGPTLAHCHQSSIPVRARLGPPSLAPPCFPFLMTHYLRTNHIAQSVLILCLLLLLVANHSSSWNFPCSDPPMIVFMGFSGFLSRTLRQTTETKTGLQAALPTSPEPREIVFSRLTTHYLRRQSCPSV